MVFFFFNDTATTEIYTLSLHDALPIYKGAIHLATGAVVNAVWDLWAKEVGKPVWELVSDMSPEELVRIIDFRYLTDAVTPRSEEHTSELQSRQYLVCRLLLEKKKTIIFIRTFSLYTSSYTLKTHTSA